MRRPAWLRMRRIDRSRLVSLNASHAEQGSCSLTRPAVDRPIRQGRSGPSHTLLGLVPSKQVKGFWREASKRRQEEARQGLSGKPPVSGTCRFLQSQ